LARLGRKRPDSDGREAPSAPRFETPFGTRSLAASPLLPLPRPRRTLSPGGPMRCLATILFVAILTVALGCASIVGRLPSYIDPSFSAAPVGLEGAIIAGEVRDWKGRPIQGAILIIAFKGAPGPGYTRVITDPQGRFSVALPRFVGDVGISVFARRHCKIIGEKYPLREGSLLSLSIVMTACSCGPWSSCDDCSILLGDTPRSMVDPRSTESGATVDISPRTGEPSVHPH